MIINFNPPKHIVVDFSPLVFLRAKTHSYFLIREKKGKGQFLTLEQGVIEVVSLTKDTDDLYKVWIHSDGASDKAYIGFPLVPYNYDFLKAIRSLHESTLSKSAAADREIRNILGLGASEVVLEEGTSCSLADICIELGIETGEARKILRTKQVEKPGARWEWSDHGDIQHIRELLSENKPD